MHEAYVAFPELTAGSTLHELGAVVAWAAGISVRLDPL